LEKLNHKGGSIAYTDAGKGTSIVFLHGFLGSKEIWTDYSKKLSKRNRVVCIDLPGHGDSSCYGYSHSLEFMAECVMAVLKHLHIRKFYLVGHSMGGYVSMAIGESHPDYIKGLVLFHSSVSDDPPAKRKERDKLIRLIQRDKKLFVKEAIPNLFNQVYKPYKRAIASSIKQALNMSVQGIIAAIEGMKIRKNREIVLKFTPYKVLYIIGKKDNVLPFEKLMAEVEISENASSLVLENSGHMGFIEDPDACLEGIRSMLK